MPGVFLGLSPVAYCRETIAVGLAAERFGAKFFGDGAIPSGVLSCEHRLGQDNVTLLRDIWNDRYRHRRKVAVLTEGLKFQPISVNPDESQFIETRQFNTTQIARLFGVPAHMIGGTDESSLTYANTESRALDYLRYSVNTWLVRIETALGRLLPRQQYAKLNAGGSLRSTTKERYEAHEIALRAGFLTVDEVRALEDLPPLPQPASSPGQEVIA